VIVVDANVAIKWTINQPLRAQARALLSASQTLVAPAMFVAEVTTAIWQYVRAGQIGTEQAQQGLSLIVDQISLLEEDAELTEDALGIGLELGHAPCDCFYLVSAMRRNAPLVTVDKRFINRLANTRYKSHVIHLADWT
jgi:predicted nucleic acid-binding protein